MEHKLRWLFLREFTKHLIENSISDEERKLIQEDIKRGKEIFIPQIPPQTIRVMPQKMQKPLPIIKPLPGYMDLGKLNLLISDPRVNQIECFGSKKEIIVKISGQPQKTRIELTKEEIDSVIKSFSEKARIPLIRGVFRAALGNLILTAVTFDFVDTRFTIQKKAPFEKLN